MQIQSTQFCFYINNFTMSSHIRDLLIKDLFHRTSSNSRILNFVLASLNKHLQSDSLFAFQGKKQAKKMRRVSVVTPQLSQSHEDLCEKERYEDSYEEFQDIDIIGNSNLGAELSCPQNGLAPSKSFSSFWAGRGGSTPQGMTSRPSFISLMLIASDDELSRLPRLPAPLQVETDTYQKCGWEDVPKFCSHLPIINLPDSDDEGDNHHGGILQSIIHLPERMRKISADKQRLNIFALPDQEREQLKNMYVY